MFGSCFSRRRQTFWLLISLSLFCFCFVCLFVCLFLFVCFVFFLRQSAGSCLRFGLLVSKPHEKFSWENPVFVLFCFSSVLKTMSRSWNYTKGVANQRNGTARILKIHERTVIYINQITIRPHPHPPKNLIIFPSRNCGARPEPNNWSRRQFNVTPFRRSRPYTLLLQRCTIPFLQKQHF